MVDNLSKDGVAMHSFPVLLPDGRVAAEAKNFTNTLSIRNHLAIQRKVLQDFYIVLDAGLYLRNSQTQTHEVLCVVVPAKPSFVCLGMLSFNGSF